MGYPSKREKICLENLWKQDDLVGGLGGVKQWLNYGKRMPAYRLGNKIPLVIDMTMSELPPSGGTHTSLVSIDLRTSQ